MSNANHYTTIVVGAGPAGIMSACQAAVRGPVLVIETMELPRDKSCGGMLNEYAQAFIAEQLHADLPADLLSSPERINFRFFDWDRNIRRPTTLGFVNVERAGFDRWLMGFLPDNVEVRGSTRVTDVRQSHDEVIVSARAADQAHGALEELTCDYLVGADGPMTEVRKHLPVSQLAHYKTIQDYLPLTGELEPYFDCVYARGIGKDYGYGYIVPKGEMAILGSVFYPGSKHVNHLHDKALDLYSSYYPYQLESRKREAWSAIGVRHVSDIVGGWGRVLLAGEAGGIFSPSSGEGISFALNSGTLAGQAIAAARENSTYIGHRAHSTSEESEALRLYRASLDPIKRNIRRRLFMYPLLNSGFGKLCAGQLPSSIVDATAHII